MSTFRTYESARELIDCLVDFHHRAARLAEKAMDQDQEERVRLVFESLFRHHQEMQENLATYEDEGEESVLKTHFSFALNEQQTPEGFIESFDDTANMSFENVFKLSRQMGDYVIGLVDDILIDLTQPHAREVFRNIRDMEEQEQKLLSKSINSLADI